jgi:hypothetical protein
MKRKEWGNNETESDARYTDYVERTLVAPENAEEPESFEDHSSDDRAVAADEFAQVLRERVSHCPAADALASENEDGITGDQHLVGAVSGSAH